MNSSENQGHDRPPFVCVSCNKEIGGTMLGLARLEQDNEHFELFCEACYFSREGGFSFSTPRSTIDNA